MQYFPYVGQIEVAAQRPRPLPILPVAPAPRLNRLVPQQLVRMGYQEPVRRIKDIG